MKVDKAYVGKWRITEMKQWDKDYIDMVSPCGISINADGTGSLRFGAVDAELDCRMKSINGFERIGFSFEGADKGDPVCGRGWATLNGKDMMGTIYFHLGDESDFSAKKQ